MARIRSLAPGTQSIRPHETEVDCFYRVLETAGGERLLHLTTFGSDQRKSKPKSSQSIQIDKATAERLVKLLRETFPEIS